MFGILKADRFNDVSLAQWIAVTSPQIIKDHLMLHDSVIAMITSEAERTKQYMV